MSFFRKLFGDSNQAQIGFDEAREIVGTYGDVLASGPVPGTVADTIELPYPKDTIKKAILVLLRATKDPSMREHLKSGYVSLADWQPGVGPSRVGLDVTKLDLASDTAELARLVVARNESANEWLPKAKAEQESLVAELKELGCW
jgi:hypothetical protein